MTEEKVKDGLYDPHGKVVSLILYILSLDPILLNTMSRAIDMEDTTQQKEVIYSAGIEYEITNKKLLEQLGPLSKALNIILIAAEYERQDARIVQGCNKHDPDDGYEFDHGYLSGSHLLFKCCQLDPEEITGWKEAFGKPGKKMERVNKRWKKVDDPEKCGFVNLKGYTSAYESPSVAMSFTGSTTDESKELVMFVICIQNYNQNGFKGFRLNDNAYSAHPYEGEMLLIDGSELVVVRVEEVTPEEEGTEVHALMKRLNKQKITFVYLFNSFIL